MERIIQKIFRIEEYLKIINSLAPDCEKRFNDPIYRGAILHYLYLISDSCIALAEMVIKHKSLRTPQSYAESFDILAENGLLEKEFAFSFAKIAGFRNFLAHDYGDVDSKVICKDTLLKMIDVKRFIGEIKIIIN